MSEASKAVRWLFQQTEPEARRVAVQQIAKVPESEAAELLLNALGDNDWRVRKEAASIAASLSRRDEVIASLVAALGETLNIGLRNAAVEALGIIGLDASAAVIDALPRLDADGRKLAVEVLGNVPDERSVAALTSAVLDEDANVRIAAAEALGSAAVAGESSLLIATQALVEALVTRDPLLKTAILSSLTRLGARLPWSLFEPLVRDPLLRRYAIAAAAGSLEPDAVRALANATGDASPTVAREAIVALGDLMANAGDSFALVAIAREALVATASGQDHVRHAALDEEDVRGRCGALPLLGLMRDPTDIPVLTEALASDEVAERADLALRLFGAAAAEPLLQMANLSRPSIRVAAFTLAATLDGADASIVRDALRMGMTDTSTDVVAAAVEALGIVGNADDLRSLSKIVTHDDYRIASLATNAVSEVATRHVDEARALLREQRTGHDPLALGCILLGAIASTQALESEDVQLLQRALSHDNPTVRHAAIDALAQAGGDAAADAVVFALADEEHEVKLAAARALGRLGRASPLAQLVAHTRDPVLAATALRALGEAAPERAIIAARPLITGTDPAIACAAAEAVGRLATTQISPKLATECEDVLFMALDHPDIEVVKLALTLVATGKGVRALARLGLCLDHESWEVRRIAAELLAQDRSPPARALLKARYDREKDASVRSAIAEAFSLAPPALSMRPSERGE